MNIITAETILKAKYCKAIIDIVFLPNNIKILLHLEFFILLDKYKIKYIPDTEETI